MAMVGGFLGGGVEMVPAGKHQFYLQWQTEDRQNLSGASFDVGGTVVQADAYGRATLMVDAGTPVTVTCTHSGSYVGDGPQTYDTPSTRQTFAYFYGAKNRGLDAYPVGSIYINADGQNPATTLGGGTWQRIAQGRTLIGEGTSDQAFAAGEEGGESKHKLTVAEMPAHSHDIHYATTYVSGRREARYSSTQSGYDPSESDLLRDCVAASTGGGAVAQQSPAVSGHIYLATHRVSAFAGA